MKMTIQLQLATYRDASYEEILHLMHDYGIGTETQAGADMAFSLQVKQARENAMQQNIWPSSGASQETRNWIEELRLQLRKILVIESHYFY